MTKPDPMLGICSRYRYCGIMSRKKGSKNSSPNGTGEVWTTCVWTTLSVTTAGPTRSAAATMAVRRDASIARGDEAESVPAATAATSMPPPGSTSSARPSGCAAARTRGRCVASTSAARSRAPTISPAPRVENDQPPCRTRGAASSDDMHALPGKPSQPGIADPHEVEAVRRRGRSSRPAALRLEGRADGGASTPAFRGANHGRDHTANHSVQEPIRLDVEAERAAGAAPDGARHAAPRRHRVAALTRERGEVVLAAERSGRLVQLRGAGANPPRPRVLPPERGRLGHDQVPVAPPHRAEARVKPGWRLGRLDHADVVRQVGVQGRPEPFRREPGAGPEAGHLPRRVASGVGPARAEHGHGSAHDPRERRFQLPLDGAGALLPLPPLEPCPFVLHPHPKGPKGPLSRLIGHGSSTPPPGSSGAARHPPPPPSGRRPRRAAARPSRIRGRGAPPRRRRPRAAWFPDRAGTTQPRSARGLPDRGRAAWRGHGARGAAARPRAAREAGGRGSSGRSRRGARADGGGAVRSVRRASARRAATPRARPTGAGRGARADEARPRRREGAPPSGAGRSGRGAPRRRSGDRKSVV